MRRVEGDMVKNE